MDIVFISGSIEVGCAEFGALENHTKELIDGSLKLPLVMKDMLKLIADIYPSTIHDVDIAAYSVHGKMVYTFEAPWLVDYTEPNLYLYRR